MTGTTRPRSWTSPITWGAAPGTRVAPSKVSIWTTSEAGRTYSESPTRNRT